MTTVSVIITTYNSERTVRQTLESVFNQIGRGERFNLNVIVVDDCSSDQTVSIVSQYPVDLLSTSANSGGPNKGRNLGLKHATGEYICFLDHDDVWHPNKIMLQLEAATLAPIITTGYKRNKDTGHTSNPVGFRLYNKNETFLKKLRKDKKLLQSCYLSSIMIHGSLKNILFEEHFGMLDFDWVLRLMENRSSVEVTANLVTRHVDTGNLSLNKDYRKKDYYYSLMFLETLEEKYPREVGLAYKRINGSRARYYYLMGEMREARKYLLKAMPGIKEALYYVTSFYGSRWVKKRFSIFG